MVTENVWSSSRERLKGETNQKAIEKKHTEQYDLDFTSSISSKLIQKNQY